MSGVLRLSNNVTGRSTIIASAIDDQTYILPTIGGTLLTGGSNSELIFPPGTAALPGLHVQGDVDTGLYAPAANTLAISTGGAERLRVDNSGNVGLGTKSPSGRLTIQDGGYRQGIVLERNGSTIDRGFIYIGDGTNSTITDEIYLDAYNTAFHFRQGATGTNETVTFNSAGNVGIGVTNPGDYHPNANGLVMDPGITLANTSQGSIYFADSTSGTGQYVGQLNYDHSTDAMTFVINNAERMRIDNDGRLLLALNSTIGGNALLQVEGSGNRKAQFHQPDTGSCFVQFTNSTTSSATSRGFEVGLGADEQGQLWLYENTFMRFATNNTERVRIDNSGRLLVGTSSASSNDGAVVIQGYGGVSAGEGTIDLVRGNNVTAGTQGLGSINFGHSQYQGASIDAESEAAWTEGSSHPSRLVFRTTANGTSSPTERLRITNQGIISVAQALSAVTPANGLNNGGIFIRPTTVLDNTPFVAEASSNAESVALLFANTNGVVGSIRVSGSATQYNESSDYRLKENIVDITDGITRLKQLKPRRFNFIADAATTVDGFIAHEAQAVIPEAVHGTKDEVDDKGQAIMQGIDKSKLVPLLTAALQETIAKLESLETEVASLRSK